MLKSLAGFGAAALIVLGVALGGSTANAQSVMKQCGDQWQAAKAAGATNGQTWPQFLSQCRAQLKAGAAAPSSVAAPAPAAPAPASAPAGTMKTAKECDAEYAANKAAIKTSGQTKRAFVAACRAGNETIPQAAVAPAPSAPAPTMHTVPAPPPTSGRAGPNSSPRAEQRRSVHVRATGSLPLPLGHGRVGQHELRRLSFLGHPQLRAHQGRRLHVRGGREGGRRSGGQERAAPVGLICGFDESNSLAL